MYRVCVFAGTSTGVRQDYVAAAQSLGKAIAQKGAGLVYGGASIGLMGAVADAVLEAGGEVIGVAPRKLFPREEPHKGLTKLHIVGSMHRRKALMADLADGFIALPGGFGTFDELFEAVTWAQIGIHSKPIGLLNVSGYFDPLLSLVDHATAEGFIRLEHKQLLVQEADASSLLERLYDRAELLGRQQRARSYAMNAPEP